MSGFHWDKADLWDWQIIQRRRRALIALFERPYQEFLERVIGFDDMSRRDLLIVLQALAQRLETAQILVWEKEIWEAALKGAQQAFTGVEMQAEWCPLEQQFWMLEEGGTTDPLAEYPMVIIAGLIGKCETAPTLQQWLIVCDPSEPAPVVPYLIVSYLPFGKPVSEPLAGTIAGLRFLDLPFIGRELLKPTRQVARALARRHESFSEFRRVILRRRAVDRPEAEGEAREFSCHFLVRGHWRRRAERWGPGDPIYISPHVRGDLEQPFRQPRQTVFHVAR